MKFLKLIALMLALFTLLTLAVSCNSGDQPEDTTKAAETTKNDGVTTAPFITKITVIALDAEGKEVEVFSTDEAIYNGLKADTSALTASEIVADYCADNDIECTLDSDNCLEKVGDYTTADFEIDGKGVMWTYYVNEVKLTDYDTAVANGAEIVVKMVIVK